VRNAGRVFEAFVVDVSGLLTWGVVEIARAKAA
jgi:hypothetical protein